MNKPIDLHKNLSPRHSSHIFGDSFVPVKDEGANSPADTALRPAMGQGQGVPPPGTPRGRSLQFGPGPDAAEEAKHLRGLFLANIDLVQHQQEILAVKERTIRSLRAENETIKSRLERMERRMSLAQQRSIGTAAAQQQRQQRQQQRSRVSTSVVSRMRHDTKADDTANSPTAKRRAPRGKGGRNSEGMVNGEGSLSEGEGAWSTSRDGAESFRGCLPAFHVAPKGCAVGSRGANRLLPSRLAVRRVRPNCNVLTTDVEYYIQTPSCEPPGEDEGAAAMLGGEGGDPVPVPSWRISVVHGKYSIEGTEDLGDDALLRRHTKHETAERRRKRWDLERQRDLELLQGARDPLPHGGDTRGRGGGSGGEKGIDTFLPDPEKAVYIEVSDCIPVSAFGCPLPCITPREFALPWRPPQRATPSKGRAAGAARKSKQWFPPAMTSI